MKYSFKLASFVLLSFAIASPKSAHADRTVSTDTTQDAGTFVVDPAGQLSISDLTNDPLLTLTNGASTSGITVVVIGSGVGAKGQLRVEEKSVLFNSRSGFIGLLEGSSGSATIKGPDSVWTNGSELYVGYIGQGTLNIENGGTVTSTNAMIAADSDSTGKATVTGPGSKWNIENTLNVGFSGQGTLNIENGGTVTSSNGGIGQNSKTGSVTITGTGSQWNIKNKLSVGKGGGESSINVRIENGGAITSAASTIGLSEVTITGPGSKWETSGILQVSALGKLYIENGGLVTSSEAIIGPFSRGDVTASGTDSKWQNTGNLYLGAFPDDDRIQSSSDSKLVVKDSAIVKVGGFLFLGARSTLDIQSGGVIKVDDTLTVDAVAGYIGKITGDGGTIQGDVINHGLIAPGNSPGVLTIDGNLTTTGIVQFELAGIGTGLFDQMIVTGELNLGGVIELDLIDGFNPAAGNSFKLLSFGSLIDSGFTFDLTHATLATNLSWDIATFATDGTIRVVPEASSLLLAGMVTLAGLFFCRKNVRPQVASLVLLSLALVSPKSAHADRTVTTDTTQDGGTFVVDPAGGLRISDATNNPLLTLTNGANSSGITGMLIGTGTNVQGQLLVENKSSLSNSGSAVIGFGDGSIGSATITGTDSMWTNGGDLNVGLFSGQGTLNIENGGTVASSQAYIAQDSDSSGTVTVADPGSNWDIEKNLYVGGFDHGVGSLNIENGGIVTCANSDVAIGSGTGSVIVTGAGSQLKMANTLYIDHTNGKTFEAMRVENGGTVTSAAGNIGQGLTITGPGSRWDCSGQIVIGNDNDISGGMTIENGGIVTSSEGVVGPLVRANVTVSGTGSKWQNSGNLYVGAVLFDDQIQSIGISRIVVQENAMVEVGGLFFLGAQSTLNVQSGGVVKVYDTLTVDAFSQYMGTLTGNGGTIQGDVINHGLIAPGNSPGILTIDGDLTTTGIVQFELAGIGTGLFDQLIVTGELNLGGVVELDLIDGFNPTAGSSFKLLSFGSLIDSGFTFDLSHATLATNLSWDTSAFITDGTIRVVPEASSLMLAGMVTFAGSFVWRKNGS